jgi:hypothetical protein
MLTWLFIILPVEAVRPISVYYTVIVVINTKYDLATLP